MTASVEIVKVKDFRILVLSHWLNGVANEGVQERPRICTDLNGSGQRPKAQNPHPGFYNRPTRVAEMDGLGDESVRW